MANGFQTLKFFMVDFKGAWERKISADAGVEYTAAQRADMAVVVETDPGTFMTYIYKIEPRGVVYVNGQVIHIHGDCRSQQNGNIIKCD